MKTQLNAFLATLMIGWCAANSSVEAATRLRGAMIDPNGIGAADLQVLGQKWNANLVRCELVTSLEWASGADEGAYRGWLAGLLAKVDALLPECERNGLQVVIDLHTPPGGADQEGVARVLTTPWARRAFLSIWDELARRYASNPTVWGYDLLNEPLTGRAELMRPNRDRWHALALEASRRIRRVDTRHVIIVEPAYGLPEQLPYMPKLPVSRVVYSVHMYHPGTFTHQGVFGRPTGVRYVSATDKAKLLRSLKPVVSYQRRHGVSIYIGEFSAARWAPREDARDYLRDCISIFEEHGWNWTYHAFREAGVWDVELGSNPAETDRNSDPRPTRREMLLRGWFARNMK